MTMGLLIAVTLAVLVLIVFDAIAFRFGADSRPGYLDDRSELTPKFL
jgi:hypothetical protein